MGLADLIKINFLEVYRKVDFFDILMKVYPKKKVPGNGGDTRDVSLMPG